jgi:Transposase
MAKKVNKRSRRYPIGFQRDAVERMKHCSDIALLAQELGVSRGVLYLWKRKAEGLPSYREALRQAPGSWKEGETARQLRELQAQVATLEGELGRRSIEASFFKSALRKVEALRRQHEEPGEMPSTKKSAAGRSRKAK